MTRRELYELFLDCQWWRDLSFERRKRSKFRCDRCGKREQCQSHHKFYRDHWFDTQLEDLECVCRECHAKEHGIVEASPQFANVPEFVLKAQPPQPDNVEALRDLYDLRSRRKISRQEFLKRRLELGGSALGNTDQRRWKKHKINPSRVSHPVRKKKRKKRYLRIPARFQDNRRGMIWCTPRHHWVNRGTSSN